MGFRGNRGKSQGTVLFFCLVAICMVVESSAFGAGALLKLPCAETGAATGLFRSCSELEAQVDKDLSKIVDQKLRCFYQQQDTDLTQPTSNGQASCTEH